jgi:hypothetical protein
LSNLLRIGVPALRFGVQALLLRGLPQKVDRLFAHREKNAKLSMLSEGISIAHAGNCSKKYMWLFFGSFIDKIVVGKLQSFQLQRIR